jgi:hypothetical protein
MSVNSAMNVPRNTQRRLPGGPRAERTAAQKRFTAVAPFLGVVAVVIMVFDHRFGWSPAVPAWLSLVGDALVALGIVSVEGISKAVSSKRRLPSSCDWRTGSQPGSRDSDMGNIELRSTEEAQ